MTSRQRKVISLPFTVVDVFTEMPYSGNPLAIVRLPPSTEFSPQQAQLQAVAAEFNLSETIFLEDATEEDLQKERRRARIFTVTREILFAGHPTIGAATWLLHHSDSAHTVKTLVPGAGPIPIEPISARPGYVKAITPHTYHQHNRKLSAKQTIALHQTLEPFISAEQHFPIISIVYGMTFALIELGSLEALAAAKLNNQNANVIADSQILDEGWEHDSPIGVYLYVRRAEAEVDEIEVVRTRMFIRGIEDPATGSAASALSGYLAKQEVATKGQSCRWKVVQGVEMGRRSEIGVQVERSQDQREMQITLSGTAVVVSEGTIRVFTNEDDRSG